MAQIGHLFLQRGQLSRERAQGHKHLEEVCGQSQRLCRRDRSRLRRLLGERRQAAMMRLGQPAQVFLRQPCAARIVRR